MIFESEIYFQGDAGKQLVINDYNSAFKNGILICPHLLYYLIIGIYSQNQEKFHLEDIEKTNYLALIRLLNELRTRFQITPLLFITPHTFTKFIHFLWERKMDSNHYKQIIELFKNELGYIKEESIEQADILNLKDFKCKILGISETAIIVLRNKKNNSCIISSNSKIFSEYKENFLYIDFNELLGFVKEEERKNKIK